MIVETVIIGIDQNSKKIKVRRRNSLRFQISPK